MFSAFQTFGRLGAGGLPFSERALWPQGASSPGLWIDPAYTPSEFQDSAGTTPISTVGTVLDSSNPVGLVLDRKGGLVLGPELVPASYAGPVSGSWLVGASEVTRNGSSGGQATVNLSSAPSTSKTYLVCFSVSNLSGDTFGFRLGGVGTAYNVTSNGVYTARIAAGGTSLSMTFIPWGGSSGQATITNISVREIPGLHLLQSTSAARPVASARVNLLTYSEDFSNAAWVGSGTKPTVSSGFTDPLGGNSACKLQFTVGGTANRIQQMTLRTNVLLGDAISVYLRGEVGSESIFLWDGWSYTVVSLTTTWKRYSHVSTTNNASHFLMLAAGSGTPTIYAWGAQAQIGGLTAYQRVGAASDYTATGFPLYAKFDGTDDALASATFPAGTFTSSMDCLIAVRRDSADMAIVGLYTAQGSGNWFGLVLAGDGSRCFSGVGSPTVFVDGVQLSGGTYVTCGTLHTALTVGAWHIMEFRGMDMSAWTATLAGNYGSGYHLNGAIGKILLFASGQDANRDKARARMAAYFGVTLP